MFLGKGRRSPGYKGYNTPSYKEPDTKEYQNEKRKFLSLVLDKEPVRHTKQIQASQRKMHELEKGKLQQTYDIWDQGGGRSLTGFEKERLSYLEKRLRRIPGRGKVPSKGLLAAEEQTLGQSTLLGG